MTRRSITGYRHERAAGEVPRASAADLERAAIVRAAEARSRAGLPVWSPALLASIAGPAPKPAAEQEPGPVRQGKGIRTAPAVAAEVLRLRGEGRSWREVGRETGIPWPTAVSIYRRSKRRAMR